MKNVVPVKDVLQKINKWCSRIGKMCIFEKSMKKCCSRQGRVVKNEKCLIFILKMCIIENYGPRCSHRRFFLILVRVFCVKVDFCNTSRARNMFFLQSASSLLSQICDFVTSLF